MVLIFQCQSRRECRRVSTARRNLLAVIARAVASFQEDSYRKSVTAVGEFELSGDCSNHAAGLLGRGTWTFVFRAGAPNSVANGLGMNHRLLRNIVRIVIQRTVFHRLRQDQGCHLLHRL